MKDDEIKEVVLEAFETSLAAQLRAIRRLRGGPKPEKGPRKRRSQVDIVEDILRKAGRPLHITEILERVEKVHGVRLERESIVSALAKKIQRNERFVRTARNTFALKGGE
jgi:hypothetical protein